MRSKIEHIHSKYKSGEINLPDVWWELATYKDTISDTEAEEFEPILREVFDSVDMLLLLTVQNSQIHS